MKMIDIREPEEVEIQLGREGQIWVIVDDECLFRAYKCKNIRIEDFRPKKSKK